MFNPGSIRFHGNEIYSLTNASADAVAHIFNNKNQLPIAATLASFQNKGTERVAIKANGTLELTNQNVAPFKLNVLSTDPASPLNGNVWFVVTPSGDPALKFKHDGTVYDISLDSDEERDNLQASLLELAAEVGVTLLPIGQSSSSSAGSSPIYTSNNYISNGASLVASVSELDAQMLTTVNSLVANIAYAENNRDAVTNISQLVGVNLDYVFLDESSSSSSAGSSPIYTSDNYINDGDSIIIAVSKLDDVVKDVFDRDVETRESLIELSERTGISLPPVGSSSSSSAGSSPIYTSHNYIEEGDPLTEAVSKLDSDLHTAITDIPTALVLASAGEITSGNNLNTYPAIAPIDMTITEMFGYITMPEAVSSSSSSSAGDTIDLRVYNVTQNQTVGTITFSSSDTTGVLQSTLSNGSVSKNDILRLDCTNEGFTASNPYIQIRTIRS